MRAYYNELDSFAAAWLRELIAGGVIAPGDVDERPIADVQPADLAGYTQCHFFAGIGVWSYALRNAGWADDARVWTGSCPCPSFSASGKGLGFDDPRHLWPAWFRLIRECRPGVVFGEQVASKASRAWLDVVSADLEGSGYAIGSADLCAAGVGAPHIRQRLYFVADAEGAGGRADARPVRGSASPRVRGAEGQDEWRAEREAGRSSDSVPTRVVGDPDASGRARIGRQGQVGTAEPGDAGELGDPPSGRCGVGGDAPRTGDGGHVERAGGTGHGGLADADGGHAGTEGLQRSREHGLGPTHDGTGFWSDVRWHPCRDGKLRPVPVEPALFPLAARTPGRVGLLRGAGNAIVAPLAQEFIKAYLDIRGGGVA